MLSQQDNVKKVDYILRDLFEWAGIPIREDFEVFHLDELVLKMRELHKAVKPLMNKVNAYDFLKEGIEDELGN